MTRFLGPRYWPVWLGVGCMWLAGQLPYRLQLAVGRVIGRVAQRVIKKRRRIAARNIDLCFPDYSAAQKQTLLKRHFESIGIGLMEMSLGWWASPARIAKLTAIEGLEHLQRAQRDGHGVVLLAGHFTTIEIGGILLTRQIDIDAMYRKFENPLFEEIMRRQRSRWARTVIKRGDFRQMLRSLRKGHIVLYMPDQAYVRQNAVSVPFFGHPAPTNTGTERLTRATGARVVPFLPMRKYDGSGYQLKIFPPLEDFPGPDKEANATRVNQVFEEHIKAAPEQYLWIHRRFKGAAGVYTDEE
ncbi:MAG: LpxL/LpxP family Kdo(2)-lipid IV(A) lauroyl/palmitoleoyl acyltransferase [Gammaproteobacteria bacterium]|nr:LpxL/LpxP family Kdo(2)-lipid IV(A) lauroyl/palmitoleoyl acyltransferase [Gammaproteobacteria bacterium]